MTSRGRGSKCLFVRHVPCLALVLATCLPGVFSLAGGDTGLRRAVLAARAVEAVRWSHRVWPRQNPGPKPSLDAVASPGIFRERVLDALAMSLALERWWHRAIGPRELEAELRRMARRTRAPARLREMFAAAGNDAALAAEAIARPVLAERLLRSWYRQEPPANAPGGGSRPLPFDEWWKLVRPGLVGELLKDPSLVPLAGPGDGLSLPPLEGSTGCDEGDWSPVFSGLPDETAGAVAVWTGAEMLVWGGSAGFERGSGWGYDPATDTWRQLSLEGAPSPRNRHAAVWTGREMIVWGGSGTETLYLGDGARYDPVGDSWTPVSSEQAPAPRYDHVAVWTGREMIVWGGDEQGVGDARSGGRYDPATDTWRPTSTEGAPLGSRRAAAWTGRWMIVWPGIASRPSLYDPSTDTWTRGTDQGAPDRRLGPVSAWTGTCFAVWGGSLPFGDGVHYYGDGGCYVPDEDRWEPMASGGAPSPRDRSAAAWTGDRLVVWGGRGPDGRSLGDGAAWIAAENRWETLSGVAAPAPRYEHAAVWTGREAIFWGGRGETGEALRSGGRYDPGSDSWVPTADTSPAPRGRRSFASVWTGEEFIVWGGRNQRTVLGDGAAWDPATAEWRPLPPGPGVPCPRWDHRAVWTGREVIFWGGTDGTVAESASALGDGSCWDPVTRQWRPVSVLGAPPPRFGFSAVWSGREMIVWGGEDFSRTLDAGGRYDPRTDSWIPMAANPIAPKGARGHGAAWLDGWMVTWGGEYWNEHGATYEYVERGSRYDPAGDRWEPISTDGAPALRVDVRATPVGEEIVFWGGWDYSSGSLDTGGRYDPHTDSWRPMSTLDAPGGRYDHVQVWNGRRLLVWAGYDGLVPLRSGGTYDPETDEWEAIPTEGAPAAAYRGGGAWTGELFLAWGGAPASSSGGTWCTRCGDFPWYRDADGDGHGDPGDEVRACTVPAGYVAFGDDCDDADPDRYPGRPESCNGVDDDCDGTVDDAFPPPGHPGLSVDRQGRETAVLSWPELVGADGYDVDAGDLGTLAATGSLFESVERCLADDLPDTEVSDAEPVAPGEGWWYLVRGENCAGPGTFNSAAPGQVGERDSELRMAPGGCP